MEKLERPSRVFTITEVAEILRVHPTTIYRLIKRGILPGVRVGSSWRISRASIEIWLARGSPSYLTPRV